MSVLVEDIKNETNEDYYLDYKLIYDKVTGGEFENKKRKKIDSNNNFFSTISEDIKHFSKKLKDNHKKFF